MQGCTKESPGQSRLEQSQATPGTEPAWVGLLAACSCKPCLWLSPSTHRCALMQACMASHHGSLASPLLHGQLLRAQIHPTAPEEADPSLGSAKAQRAPAQAGEVLQSHPKLLAFSFCHVLVSVGWKLSFRY